MRVPRRRAPMRGRGGHRSGLAVRGQEHADPGVWEVFAVGRGAGFVVVAEVTARAASELRLADGGPVWATVEAPGWPATGPERHRPGVVARPAAWTTAHAPNATNLASGSEEAKVRRWNRPQVNPSANPYDGSIRTGTQEMAETGRFAAPGAARNGAIRRGARPPAAQELHPDCLQLPHRGGEIVDRKPTTGLVEKCSWSWSPRAEHLEGASLGELEGGEVGLLLAGGQAEDRLEECPQGRVLACPGAYPTNALDPHPCRSPAQELGVRDPATPELAVRGLASAGQAQLGDGDTAQGGVELPAATAAATMAALFQS
jgi:hypothetical protein